MVWLATAHLTTAPEHDAAFKASVQPRLFRQFEVAERWAVNPKRFEPTVTFHEWATHRLFAGRSARRTPYSPIRLGNDLEIKVTSLSASVFPGDIAVVRVAAIVDLPTTDPSADLASLQALRSSKEIPEIRGLISLVLARLAGIDVDAAFVASYDDYFLMLAELPLELERFDEDIDKSKAEVVALLIGTRDPSTLSSGVVETVLETNADLNSKSRNELMLLNRKGVLLLRPAGRYGGPHVDRFAKTRDLAMINQFTRTFLDDLQSTDRGSDQPTAAILRQVRHWIKRPELTFFSSFSHTETWKALSRAMLLDDNLDAADETTAMSAEPSREQI